MADERNVPRYVADERKVPRYVADERNVPRHVADERNVPRYVWNPQTETDRQTRSVINRQSDRRQAEWQAGRQTEFKSDVSSRDY